MLKAFGFHVVVLYILFFFSVGYNQLRINSLINNQDCQNLAENGAIVVFKKHDHIPTMIWTKNLTVSLYRLENNLKGDKVFVFDEEWICFDISISKLFKGIVYFESNKIYLYYVKDSNNNVLYQGVISGQWRTKDALEASQEKYDLVHTPLPL